MTPKEKAKELFDKYVDLSGIFVGDYESEKSMCLIAVDEILESHYKLLSGVNTTIYKYWIEVKQEIEKL
jgi:hypothetical protein